MENSDFLQDLGELALGSRLKRLGDRMMAEANATYEAFGHSAQPRWFVLLALLHRRGRVPVVEASAALGISQPAISQFSRELEDRGWLKVQLDENDGRKRLMVLTRAGKNEVNKMQQMWQAVDLAAKELCEEAGANFFSSLQRFETALQNKSLSERALEKAGGAKQWKTA